MRWATLTLDNLPESEVISFSWGQPEHIGSAAYWAEQALAWPGSDHFRLGSNLAEEVVACILGGHGMSAEVGLAAFSAVREAGLLECTPTAADVECVLREPLAVASGAKAHYRFPRQRATRVAAALAAIANLSEEQPPIGLRNSLMSLPGVGPKTASWVVRNHTGSSDVAIVDVHLRRAGFAAGFFSETWRLPRDYTRFEVAFLAFARAAGVAAAQLDACIWGQLHELGALGPELLSAARRTRAAQEVHLDTAADGHPAHVLTPAIQPR